MELNKRQGYDFDMMYNKYTEINDFCDSVNLIQPSVDYVLFNLDNISPSIKNKYYIMPINDISIETLVALKKSGITINGGANNRMIWNAVVHNINCFVALS